jgi:hypothetical protein
MICSALDLPIGSQKTPPDPEFRNPADLVNQLAFLARMLPFVPHRAILCFPARLDRRWKRRYRRGYITDYNRHPFHLRALKLPKVTLLRPALLLVQCIPSSIRGGSPQRISSMGEEQPHEGNTLGGPDKNAARRPSRIQNGADRGLTPTSRACRPLVGTTFFPGTLKPPTFPKCFPLGRQKVVSILWQNR